MNKTKLNDTNDSFENQKFDVNFSNLLDYKDFCYIKTVIYRVLPNFKLSTDIFESLRDSKIVKTYFKNTRSLQEYPGLYDYFKKRGFDMSLADTLRGITTPMVRSMFYKNLNDQIKHVSDKDNNLGMCGITFSEIQFINYQFPRQVMPLNTVFTMPTLDDMINSLTKSASAGLPNPYLRKRDLINDLRGLYPSIKSGRIKLTDIMMYPAAAFMRLQVRVSGLKTRVVSAVSFHLGEVERFYNLWFRSGLEQYKGISSIVCGFTQLEVSKLVLSLRGYEVFSIDTSLWDWDRQKVLSVISFRQREKLLKLSSNHSRNYRTSRNIHLNMLLFHPMFSLYSRECGTVSGSGYTSDDNSMCNWNCNTVLIKRYCAAQGICAYKLDYKIFVSGDDLLLAFKNHSFDYELYFKLAKSGFNLTMRLEIEPSKTGVRCFFLGSLWIDGKPYRSEKHMVASAIFGTGNFPKMSFQELLQSRFFEVFGNSCDCYSYFKRLRLPYILKRLFFFSELSNPHRFDNLSRIKRLQSNTTSTSVSPRGFWYDTKMSEESMFQFWSER